MKMLLPLSLLSLALRGGGGGEGGEGEGEVRTGANRRHCSSNTFLWYCLLCCTRCSLLSLQIKSYGVTIQMKATKQYFPVVLFIMLYKVVITFESTDEILKCDHSNKSYWAVHSCGVVFMLYKKVLLLIKHSLCITFNYKLQIRMRLVGRLFMLMFSDFHHTRAGSVLSWVSFYVTCIKWPVFTLNILAIQDCC